MDTTTPLSRHDYTKAQQAFFSLAVSLGIIDVTEFVVLGANLGGDFSAIAEEVLSAAYAGVHSEEGRDKHGKIVDAFDAIAAEEWARENPRCRQCGNFQPCECSTVEPTSSL